MIESSARTATQSDNTKSQQVCHFLLKKMFDNLRFFQESHVVPFLRTSLRFLNFFKKIFVSPAPGLERWNDYIKDYPSGLQWVIILE